MVDRRFFDALMADKKLSLRALAKKMEMSHTQLSLTFSGSRRLQLEEAAKMADLLGVSLQSVAHAYGITATAPNHGRCSVIGALTGTGTVDVYAPNVIERASLPAPDMSDDIVAIQARTADSPLSWLDGWLFFLRRSDGVEPDCIGRFCFATLSGGRSVMATLRRGYREGTFNLSGPVSDSSVGILSASPVIMTRN